MSIAILPQKDFQSWFDLNIPGIKWHGDEGQARCPLPTHGSQDRNPSFTVNQAKGTFYCHTENVGGGMKELARLLGVESPFPERRRKETKGKKIVATYDYQDANGNLVYQAVRYNPKDFRQRRPDPDKPGGWIWNMKSIESLPYRLPEVLAALGRGETVFVVEGEKDAENLAALGLAATCNHGGAGKWTGAHSGHFPSGAEVVILPDHDDPGRDHARKVATQLTDRGCRARVAELPGLHPKGDVSDWIAAGHGKEELLELVGQTAYWEVKPEPGENSLSPVYDEWLKLFAKTRYCVDVAGNLCYRKYYANGEVEEVPIANFLARPVREITRDNGLEAEKTFEIAGLLTGGTPLPAVAVPAKDFASMSWVAASWGLGANVEPGTGAKDKTRHAIQCLANGVERETVYTHLGWRKIGERWVYLHAGGAIGAEGVTVDVSAEGLGRYTLPEVTEMDAVKCSLRLLDVAPLEVTIPLFSKVFLSPLCDVLRRGGVEPAFILWLAGVTGAMKSTLAALFLSHFGEFTGKNLPASFKDTGNSLEKKAFLTKDSLLVVDDYHPSSGQLEARKMEQAAQQILRGYGDRVARGRMRADTSLRPSYVPRGLCLVTGEDMPDAGQSTTARFLAVELKKGDIDEAILGELQANADKLAQAMRGYIEWLAPRLDEIPEKLRDQFQRRRQKATADGQHARIPEVVAWLHIGFQAGLDYAEQAGAITTGDKETLLGGGWRVLVGLARKQARRIEEEKPAAKFLHILGELFSSGEVCAKHIGFESDDDENKAVPFVNGFIGWQDREWYYLLPEVVYRRVAQFASTQGGHFPVTIRTLWKHLDAEGLIFVEKTGGETRRLIKESIPGAGRPRVLKLKKDALK